jgi:UTP-glucose-1-phosphate uridylyltransferase
MKPTLLVLAAGMGSRYGGLKQLDGVGPHNEPILEYSAFDAIRAGFGKLVFVIRPDFAAEFKAQVTRKFDDRLPVEFVYQNLHDVPASFSVPPSREKPWGTGHAILCAAEAINSPFVAINADDFYGAAAYQKLSDYLSQIDDLSRNDYAMVGYTLRNTLSPHGTVSRGLCQVQDGYLQSIEEVTKIEKDGSAARYFDGAGQAHPLTGDELASMNIWGFTPALFDHLRRKFERFLHQHGHQAKSEFYIPSVVGELVDEGTATVKMLHSTDPWFGVTYQEDKPIVVQNIQQLIASGRYPKNLWA